MWKKVKKIEILPIYSVPVSDIVFLISGWATKRKHAVVLLRQKEEGL